jgi:hypothetical protein
VRQRGAFAVLALASVIAAPLALASSAATGEKVLGGRGYATNVTVSFTAPAGYTIDSANGYENWKGPLYTYINTGSTTESNLHFDVHSATTRSMERAARDKIGTDMGGIPTRQVVASAIRVPHLVRGRKVGDIKGFFVIRQGAKEDYEGWTEAGLAFSLGKGYPVLAADVDTTGPSDDSNNTIQNTLPSAWNRRVVEEGVRGIAVVGNLAPSKLTARVQGRRVSGRATDALGHVVVQAKVALRAPNGKRCCTALTRTDGTFALTVPGSAGSGAFQLSVTAGGAKATKSVRLG